MRIPGALVAWIGLIAAVPAALGEEQRPPAFEQLRYEEDFSYLKDPAVRTGDALSLEPIKYLPLSQTGDSTLSK